MVTAERNGSIQGCGILRSVGELSFVDRVLDKRFFELIRGLLAARVLCGGQLLPGINRQDHDQERTPMMTTTRRISIRVKARSRNLCHLKMRMMFLCEDYTPICLLHNRTWCALAA